MSRFFSLLSIVLYTGGVFFAGMLVSQLYALYVLIFTGTVFVIGVYIGEKLEEKYARQSVPAGDAAGVERMEDREADALSVKRG